MKEKEYEKKNRKYKYNMYDCDCFVKVFSWCAVCLNEVNFDLKRWNMIRYAVNEEELFPYFRMTA